MPKLIMLSAKIPSIIIRKYLRLFFPEQIIHNNIIENKLAFEPDDPKKIPAAKQISNPNILGLYIGIRHARKKRLKKEKNIFPPTACAKSLKFISSKRAENPKPKKTAKKLVIE